MHSVKRVHTKAVPIRDTVVWLETHASHVVGFEGFRASRSKLFDDRGHACKMFQPNPSAFGHSLEGVWKERLIRVPDCGVAAKRDASSVTRSRLNLPLFPVRAEHWCLFLSQVIPYHRSTVLHLEHVSSASRTNVLFVALPFSIVFSGLASQETVRFGTL